MLAPRPRTAPRRALARRHEQRNAGELRHVRRTSYTPRRELGGAGSAPCSPGSGIRASAAREGGVGGCLALEHLGGALHERVTIRAVFSFARARHGRVRGGNRLPSCADGVAHVAAEPGPAQHGHEAVPLAGFKITSMSRSAGVLCSFANQSAATSRSESRPARVAGRRCRRRRACRSWRARRRVACSSSMPAPSASTRRGGPRSRSGRSEEAEVARALARRHAGLDRQQPRERGRGWRAYRSFACAPLRAALHADSGCGKIAEASSTRARSWSCWG